MSTSPELQQSSETTGPMSLGKAVSNCLGQARGVTIAEGQLTASGALAQLRPSDTDRRVADALQHISGRPPVFRRRTMFPENAPMYSITEAASWKCDDADQQERGLAAVTFSLRPAPEARITQALFELRTLTRGRVNREASEDEAEALIWTQNLRQYPADIVLHTLKNWPSRGDGQWWPTWHDVLKVVEAATHGRRLLADHIRAGACLPAPTRTAEELERDDSPEAVAHRKAVVERHMAKLKREEEEERWKPREPGDIARQMRAENLKLSPEALSIFRKDMAERAVPSPDEQYDDWSKDGRAVA